MKTFSLPQARKLILLSQSVLSKGVQHTKKSQSQLQSKSKSKSKSNSNTSTLAVLERIGYVQIDTISVVQRAHHHTLWSRNSSYQVAHIDQLVEDKKVFEYWTHAAAYLPITSYRYSLPSKAFFKSGEQKHWYKKDLKLMRSIYQRIEAEGPLMAKDFVSPSNKSNGWGSKPAKQALENLFMQGDLMISARNNFHKVYDLTERVLPKTIDTSMPTDQEHGQFLVLSYLKAHGFGTLAEITYLLKNKKTQVSNAIGELLECGKIEKVNINNAAYFACVDTLLLLDESINKGINKGASIKEAKILSPFDNLLIQRKRTRAIFSFDYKLECYLPAQKRKFGYFCLPILWDGELIARADCKVDKKESLLNVIQLFIEPSLINSEAFYSALEEALDAFAKFNQCSNYIIQKTSPNNV